MADDTVTTVGSSPEISLSWQMRDREAGLLADLLRNSRLTLLYGETGVARAELLDGGVLPLLARRTEDATRNAARESRVVVPFIDHRQRGAGGGSGSIERVVLFRDWAGAPLADLQIAILSAAPMDAMARVRSHRLADMLAELCEGLGARFLIILDAFEQLWTAGTDSRVVDEFVEQLSTAVNRSDLPVNFLLSVDQASEYRLADLRDGIAGFDDSILRLRDWQAQEASPPVLTDPVEAPELAPSPVSETPSAILPAVTPRAASAAPAVERPTPKKPRRVRPPKTPMPPAVPIRADGVYAFIESTLAQTAQTSEPWHDSTPSPPLDNPPSASLRSEAPPSRLLENRERFGSLGRAAPTAEADNPRIEPPHPIDQWLDGVIAWCRRRLGMR